MKKITIPFGALLALSIVLTGCAPEVGTVIDGGPTPSATTDEVPESPDAGPVTQEETCDWDSARLDSGSADAPNGMGEDLASTIIGSWQHTHIDEGSGYEALKNTTDIRYVFPSTTRMLYCQDVQGATHQAENAVDVKLDDTNIVLPSPATGYEVMAWTHDIMVWKNTRDGSFYLLKRR